MSFRTVSYTHLQEVYNSEGANHKIFLMDWNNDGKIAPVEEAVDVSLAINNQSKVKDAAWTFVDWMIHEGADTLVNGQLQYMPARNDMELNVEGLNENGTENLEYCVEPVSYTHLDVYKRQLLMEMAVFACMNRMIFIIGSTREMCWSPMVNWEL